MNQKFFERNWKKYNEIYNREKSKGITLYGKLNKAQFKEALEAAQEDKITAKSKKSYGEAIFKNESRATFNYEVKLYKEEFGADKNLSIRSSIEDIDLAKRRIYDMGQIGTEEDRKAFWANYRALKVKYI